MRFLIELSEDSTVFREYVWRICRADEVEMGVRTWRHTAGDRNGWRDRVLNK